MAIDRKYLEEELNPALRREMQMPVNMPLLSPDQLPTGTSYRQASPSVQLPIYPTSMPYVTPELSTPNMVVSQDGVQYGAGSYVPPERAGLLSPIPGRPGTGITALPNSSELMSNTPRAAANTGLTAGEAIAQDRNQGNLISGLLGDINWKGILDQLVQTFQRPEMLTPGVSALTSFGMAGAGLRQAELVGAAAEQARADKLAGAEQVRADKFAIAQINNAPGAPEFDKTQTDLLLDITKGQGALDNLQKALELSLKSKLTGAGPQGIQGVSNLLAAFGIDPGVSDIKNYENRVARIKADLSASRIFGREMNRQELKILEKLVSDPGIFNTNTQLRNQLRSLTGSLEKTIGTKRRIIAAQFPNANIREIIEPPKSVFKE